MPFPDAPRTPIADPLCWFCPTGKAVQQEPPLCLACQRFARERLRAFLARSKFAQRLLADDPPRAAEAPAW